MTLVDDLKAAKALIDSPEKWIKGEFEEGGCYCASGAIEAACGEEPFTTGGAWAALFEAAQGAADVRSISEYNDRPETTHADIMALFDRAIAAAEASAS